MLCALFATFAVLATQWTGTAPPPQLVLLLAASSAMATLVFGAIYAVRFRWEPDRLHLPAAAGMTVLAVLVVGLAEAGPLLSTSPEAAFEAVRGWFMFSALALFVATLAPVWRGPARGLTAALAVAVAVLGALAMTGQFAGAWFAAWTMLLVAQVRACLFAGLERFLWLAVVSLGFALGELARDAVIGSPDIWAIAVPVLRTIGVSLATLGVVHQLISANQRGQAALRDFELRLEHLQLLQDEGRRSREERDHEARNALATIEFTAGVLRRRSDAVDASALEQLQGAIDAEIALLRRLLTLPEPGERHAAFSLLDSVGGVASACELRGTDLQVNVPPDLEAMGDPAATAEIMQILLNNAAKHAPGAAVAVSAVVVNEWVVLQVDDSGPGIQPERRHLVFGRGTDGGHPTSADGKGLGLYIAARLCEEMAGHIWVTESRMGGASFRFALPTMSEAATGKVASALGLPEGSEPLAPKA